MIGTRGNFDSLLDMLRDFSYNLYVNKMGIVVDIEGEEVNNERYITLTQFYSLYCLAYKDLDERKENKPIKKIDRKFVDRALSSYGTFNYFINTLIGEYRIYDDIGTGKVTYEPYQPIADFFFNNMAKKEILMTFLKNEIKNVFDEEKTNKRVK